MATLHGNSPLNSPKRAAKRAKWRQTWEKNRKARADLNREYRGECKSTGAAEHYHRLLTAISLGLAS